MSWFSKAASSSIGRKLAMSLTGLFLVSFLLVHVSGNLQLFKNDQGDAFNIYTNFMSTNGVIRVLEVGLLVGFLLHIYTSFVLTAGNRAARPQGYAYRKESPGSTWFSRNMGLSGSIVLAFLVLHLANFYYRYKFGAPDYVMIGEGTEAKPYKDMYKIVAQTFHEQWWISVFYVGAMVLLAFHLNHGFQSAFRTLGVEHKKYTPIIRQVGVVLSVAVCVLFAAMPIFFLLTEPTFREVIPTEQAEQLLRH